MNFNCVEELYTTLNLVECLVVQSRRFKPRQSVAAILIATVIFCGSAFGQKTYLNVTNYRGNSISTYIIDPQTGYLTAVSSVVTGSNPNEMSVDRSCGLVYVANSTNVSGYSIASNTGVLTEVSGSPFAAGTNPLATAIDQLSKFVYVTNNGDSTISGYRISSTSGGLSPLPGSPFTAGTNPQHPVIDPSNRFLYVSNDSGSVSGFIINPTTGALIAMAGSPWPTGSLSRFVRTDNNGKFLYVSNTGAGSISVFSIDQSTGSLTEVSGSPVSVAFNIYELQIEPLNKFAYVGSIGNGLYGFAISNSTGMLTPLPGFPLAGGNRGRMGIDPTGQFLYSSNQDTNNLDAFRIDQGTGNLSQFASFPAGSFPNSIGICSSSGVPRLTGGNKFTGDQTIVGAVNATSFAGSGAGLTNVNASSLGGVQATNYARLDTANSFNGNQSVTGNVNLSGNFSAGGTTTLGGGTPITKHLSLTLNSTFASLKPLSCSTTNLSFSGASDGDTTALGIPNSLMSGGVFNYLAWVSAANTVTVRVCNLTTNGAPSPAMSGLLRVDLWKH